MRGLLLLLALTGCDHAGTHDVIVRLGDPARATLVEVALVRGCGDLLDMRDRPDDPLALSRIADGHGSPLGRVEPGQYGLHARAIDSSCVVFAADCDTITVSADTSNAFEIFVGGRPERFDCGPGEACVGHAECEALGEDPDAGPEDAGTTQDAGDIDIDTDPDGDGLPDGQDNCPSHYNPEQEDADGDQVGDACDDAFGPCEHEDDCEDCRNCAEENVCQQQVSACEGSSDCESFAFCAGECQGDSMCIDGCAQENPNGYDVYAEAYVCVLCDGCPNRCADEHEAGLCDAM